MFLDMDVYFKKNNSYYKIMLYLKKNTINCYCIQKCTLITFHLPVINFFNLYVNIFFA